MHSKHPVAVRICGYFFDVEEDETLTGLMEKRRTNI